MVDGAAVYAVGSDGDLVCLDAATGKGALGKNLRADFGGQPGTWAYAESPLVEGDVVVSTPGGREAAVLALNKHTGNVVWKTCGARAGNCILRPKGPRVLEAKAARTHRQ